MFDMDLAVVTIIVQLIFLEGILSIDNAAVLGAMAAPLPADQPVPWPKRLAWLAAPTKRLFGMQRAAALKIGLLGAYLGRGAMLFAATFILHNLWLRVLGAAYLLYLAISHIAELDQGGVSHEGVESRTKPHAGFWPTVLVIELADLAFSLDNVIAAIALSDRLWVLMVGVAVGIVTMRFAAGIFTRMIAWEPALQTAAYLLVFAIGLTLLLKEFFHLEIGEFAQFCISAGILLGTVLVARTPALRKRNVIWRWSIRACKILRAPFNLVSVPLRMIGLWLKRSAAPAIEA